MFIWMCCSDTHKSTVKNVATPLLTAYVPPNHPGHVGVLKALCYPTKHHGTFEHAPQLLHQREIYMAFNGG